MNKNERMVETKYYRYKNLNPKGRFIDDCAIRAVANATNQGWEETLREMTEFSIKLADVPNGRKAFPKYLESKGFTKMPQPRKFDGTKYEVREWMETYEGKRTMQDYEIVISLAHHLTCIKDGKVEDIWNSSKGKCMGNYWIKRKA